MMGGRMVAQEALFYEFSLDCHVPADHWVRAIDRFVDLSEIRAHLRPFYSETGRPSIDPELMIRMLLIGYCFGIRSEHRLCRLAAGEHIVAMMTQSRAGSNAKAKGELGLSPRHTSWRQGFAEIIRNEPRPIAR